MSRRVIVALIDRLDGETFCKNFMNGAKAMVFPVVLIGCAKGVSIILTNGKVLDTISYGIANAVSGLPVALSASAMFLAHCLINILIPSASGQAAATLPIMIPVGDLIGLDRHISVLAFQFGDCLTNALTPTSAVLMAGLGIAGISWDKWIKFVGKLLVILFVYYCIMLAIATMLPNYPAL